VTVPPKKDAEMHVLSTTLVALTALVAASAQAAPVPNKAHPQGKWHETPAQNVQKSRQYDHLLTTNASFRAYRMRKECGPIKDPALRGDCMASFNTYEGH
jgi:Spy/CpxP family protein refolding chaperone